jgi:hypothetical protein
LKIGLIYDSDWHTLDGVEKPKVVRTSEYITYFGWSSFVIESSGVKLAFDPLYRELYEGSWSSLDDYRELDVVCITHGHYDHYIDVPLILQNSHAMAVSSEQVCSHLERKYGIPSNRLRSVRPGELIRIKGFEICPFSWGHREISYKRFFKEGLLRAQILPTLQFAWLNFMGSPFTAPFYGYVIQHHSGLKVMNYCEGFNDTMDLDGIHSLREKYCPDVVLAGAQLNFQEYLTSGIKALLPKKAILFHPHQPMFSKLGLVSTPTQAFADRLNELGLPMEVIVAEPRKAYHID